MTSRFWWTSALLAGIACVAFVLWQTFNTPLGFAAQQVTLTNGTVLRLVSVQYGKTHVDPFNPPWKQWMSRLPEPWTRKLKLNLPANLNTSGSNAVLSVWLTSSKAPANANQQSFGVLVGDDAGNFAGSSSGFGSATGKAPGIAHYEGHRMSVFPRRSPELRIRIYDSPWGQGKFLHEFRIRNPGLVPRDETLRLRPCPIHRGTGGRAIHDRGGISRRCRNLRSNAVACHRGARHPSLRHHPVSLRRRKPGQQKAVGPGGHHSPGLSLQTWKREPPFQDPGEPLTVRTLSRTFFSMISLPVTQARARLYQLLDETASSHEPIHITGKRSNAVLVSEDDWRSIQETLFLLSIPGMRESIREGLATPLSKTSSSPGW